MNFWDFVKVFAVGGLLCVIAQLIVDRTKIISSQILVIYITAGVILSALGLYEPVVKFAKAGATVPLTGFGYALVKGTFEAVDERGLIGVFTGGLSSTAAGIAAAIVFGYLASLVGKARSKL